MDSVISDSKSAIKQVHAFGMSSRDLMSNKLAREFGDETGKSLMTALSEQGFIQSQEIDFASCGKFSDVKLEEKLVGYEKSLVSTCNYIGKLKRSNFYEEVARFRGHLESLFIGSIISTWKNDVISPVAGTLGSMAGNFAYNKINKAFEERAKLAESPRGYQEESKEGLNREKNKEKSKEESKRQKLDPEDLINKGRAAGGDKARANADSKGAGRGKSEGGPKKYTVKTGDTVSEIAQKFGVSTDELIKANPTLANNRKTDAYGRDMIIIKPGEKIVIPGKAGAGSTSGGNTGGSKPDHGYGPEYRKPDAEKSEPFNDNRKPESEQKQGDAAEKPDAGHGPANDEFWWCDSGVTGLCVASKEDAKRAEESLREGARKIGSIILAL
ncbi:LysM domain-containing protein [Candidatus Lariskella endosymbiont of Hedychridium roseum]|uniref:LysM peptidoglycan-binding domain-containing protein n=1 Tax=Candidatus Lariskella endosymbiont of Hedychridium roseum TaxID=3077949 RepID=UPI0030D3AAEF